ncbi:MAG: hypothetical protein IPG68_06680 [Micrococcales bacterium]|nr:hypothetical protein [Micrococcales bacterium]
MRADLRAWISRDDALRAGRWKPQATELHFDNLDVPLPDGTTLRLQGSVDRVEHRRRRQSACPRLQERQVEQVTPVRGGTHV